MSGLICVQTVRKDHQQTTKVDLSKEELILSLPFTNKKSGLLCPLLSYQSVNSLDQDQARHSARPDLCSNYLQTTIADKE